MNNEVRVRMAPSPTGFFHIGSARTALYNWLFARHQGGKFILRVEDTDATRSSGKMIDVILDSLKWLELDWDEGPEVGGNYGPYFQSERKAIYQSFAENLLKEKKAYLCYCTPEEIKNERSECARMKKNWYHSCYLRFSADEIKKREDARIPKALRFLVPKDKKIVFDDLIHGQVEKMGSDLEDFVIIKSDGMATYNFACVIDDVLMKITHVIRGVEHIANTPKQVLLYETLKLPQPKFVHLPVILGIDKKKLSKRLGARSVMDYKEEGYLAEVLVNFLALLGWSPGRDLEIMNFNQLVELFTLERINPANAVFDEKRLEWMNNHYIINRLTDKKFGELLKPFIINSGLMTNEQYEVRKEWVQNVGSLMRPRLHILSDIVKNGKYFFTDDFEYDEQALGKYLNPESVEVINKIKLEMKTFARFDAPAIEINLRKFAQDNGWRNKDWIHPLRIFVTGTEAGPGLFDTLELIGQEACLRRIDRILAQYEEQYNK